MPAIQQQDSDLVVTLHVEGENSTESRAYYSSFQVLSQKLKRDQTEETLIISFHMMPETLREDSTTKIIQSNMKYTQVIQAQCLGPPSSAPNVRRLNTRTAMHPTEVEKKTSKEKLSPSAFWIRSGSLYAMKLYAVSISHGMPMPTYIFTELLQKERGKKQYE